MKITFNANFIKPNFVSSTFKGAGNLQSPPLINEEKPRYDFQIYGNNPISFRGFSCSPDNFDLKRIDGLDCPCCGKPMKTGKQLDNFVSRVSNKKGEGLQEELIKLLPYARVSEEEIVNILIDETEKHPNADLKRLVFYIAQDSKGRLETKQKAIIMKIQQQIENCPEDQRREAKEVLANALYEIDNATDETHFKRKSLVNKLKGLSAKYRDDDTYILDKAVETAETMPNTYKDKDSFFVKYKRKSSKEIVQRLCASSVATTEHVKAKSLGGGNNTGNYIPMCSDCNFNRGNMPYTEWIKLHPEMEENLQKYLNQISKMVDGNTFKNSQNYQTYISDIIKTITKETKGHIALKMPDFSEEASKESKEKQPENLPIDKQRDIWQKRAEMLQENLKETEEIYATLVHDSEFQDLCEYVKEKTKLDRLASQGEGYLHSLSETKKQKSLAKIRLKTAIKNGEKESVIKKFEEGVKVARINCEAAREQYEQSNARYETQKEKTKKIKEKVELPDEIQNKIKSKMDKIKYIDDCEVKVMVLQDEIMPDGFYEKLLSSKDMLISKVEEDIAQIKADPSYNSEEDRKMLAYYNELVEELKILDHTTAKQLKKIIPDTDPNNLMFIISEAKESIENKIKRLRGRKDLPSIQIIKKREKLEELREEKKELELEHNKDKELAKELSETRKKLTRLGSQYGKKIFEEEIAELKHRKEEVSYKLKYVNIKETIAKTKQEIEDLWMKFALSFEEEFNYSQHSNSSDETTSSSSSQ